MTNIRYYVARRYQFYFRVIKTVFYEYANERVTIVCCASRLACEALVCGCSNENYCLWHFHFISISHLFS